MSKLDKTSMSKADKKLIITSIIGSMLEYFDFMTFVFIAPILAELFFPKNSYVLGIIATYITITISYFFRPVGGIILGYLGDKYGRLIIFYLSLLLMAVPSLGMGLLPTFSQIGYTATILLIILRILQGISIGAEVPASVTYIAEKYSHKNYFFYCSWLTFGSNIGIVFASQVVRYLSNYTSHSFMYTYGWRIPFLSSGLLALIGSYLRKTARETSEFKKMQTMKAQNLLPAKELWYNNIPKILCGISICVIVSLSTSVFLIFLPSMFANLSPQNLNISTNITSLGSLVLAVFSVIFAYLTKYINPARIFNVAIILLVIILIVILFLKNDHKILLNHLEIKLYVLTVIIAISTAGINGLFFGLLADLFSTPVRLSSIALCYNIAYMIGAGLTPLWTSIYAPGFANVLFKLHKEFFYASSIILFIILLIFATFKPNSQFANYK